MPDVKKQKLMVSLNIRADSPQGLKCNLNTCKDEPVHKNEKLQNIVGASQTTVCVPEPEKIPAHNFSLGNREIFHNDTSGFSIEQIIHNNNMNTT